MMKQMTRWTLVMVFLTLIVTACGPTNTAPATEEEGDLPPVAVVKARETLAAELGEAIEDVTIGSYERAEWTDSCLGLGGPAESCLAATYSGWQVMLEADGTGYEVRTDELGDIIRINFGNLE